jgi:hypothetical protein
MPSGQVEVQQGLLTGSQAWPSSAHPPLDVPESTACSPESGTPASGLEEFEHAARNSAILNR